MTSEPSSNRIVFVVSGEDGPARAESLDRVKTIWDKKLAAWIEEPGATGKRLYVIVTDPTRPTSVDSALRYARTEIRDGIGEAGGSISDRTHVQITMSRPSTPRRPDKPTPAPAHEGLVRTLADSPDDVELFQVLADQLSQAGDPRGELIALQAALEQRRHDRKLLLATRKLIEKHRAAFLAPLEPQWLAQRTLTLRWRLGFIHEARICKLSRPSEIYHFDPLGMLEALLACPSAALLRRLTVYTWRSGQRGSKTIDLHAALRETAQHRGPPTLHDVRVPPLFAYEAGELGLHYSVGVMEEGEAVAPEHLPVRWLEIDADELPRGLSPVDAALAHPELELLQLEGGGEIDPADLASLAQLDSLAALRLWRVTTRDIPETLLAMPSLERLDAPGFPSLGTLLAGFARTNAPAHRRLVEALLFLDRPERVVELASEEDLRQATESNVAVVRERALRLLQ